MSDEIKDEVAEEATADYSAMTESQLEAKQEILEGQRDALRLKATAGDATPADTAEWQAVRSDLVKIKEARAAIAAMLIDEEPEEAPVVEAPVAEVIEITPAVEEVVEVAEEPVLVAADIDTSKLTGTGPIDAPVEEEEVSTGPAIFASMGSFSSDASPDARTGTDLTAVAEKTKNLFRSIRANKGMPTGEVAHIMGVETKSSAGEMIARAGSDASTRLFNSALVNGLLPGQDAVMASCRNPVEFETSELCGYNTGTPFWDLFNRTVDANACSFEWKNNLSLDDLNGGVEYWDACRQALVDGADETTWKPLAELPDCVDDCYSTAEAFYLTWGLKVTTDDQFCRPDRIREANDILAALRAIELDLIARSHFDAHAQQGGNVWAADLGGFGTDLGLVPALQIAISQFVNSFDYSGRYTCDDTQRFALVPEYIAKHVAIDLSLAGENANQAQSVIRDAFASAGITDVQFEDGGDYGCEGNLTGSPERTAPGASQNCIDWNCTDSPLAGVEGLCPAFGSGAALPKLSDRARIRVGHRSAFAKGSTGVVDYQVRADNKDLRQNQAEYFGESRHFFFPTGELDSGVLDLSGICPSGNRVDRTAAVDCTAIVAAP